MTMETKVVKILSDTDLVLGAGAADGVDAGMEFLIYENSEEIKDPESGDSLGFLEIVKGYVTVVNAQERLSVAKTKARSITKMRRVASPFGVLGGLSGLAALSAYRNEEYEVEKVEKLKVDKVDPTYEGKLVVRIGDKARMIEE